MPTDKKVLVVIPARWGSTRFPGKPLVKILGKPMVQWVLEQTKKAKLVSDVIVATDDHRIYDVVHSLSGKAIMTSSDHQSGTDRIVEVANKIECDIVVNVQGDEPLIPPENIDLVIKTLLMSPDSPVSTLMIAINSRSEMIDPNICKVVFDNKGRALYFTRAPIPYNRDSIVDDTHFIKGDANPKILGYKHIGIYGYAKSFLLKFSKLKVSRLEKLEKLEQLRFLDNGYSIRVVETNQNSIGVDRPEDLNKIENLLDKTF